MLESRIVREDELIEEQSTHRATRILGWLEIGVAVLLGVPFSRLFVAAVSGVVFAGGEDILGLWFWSSTVVIFALALALAGCSLVRGHRLRWWAQIPWLAAVGWLLVTLIAWA